MAHYPPLESIDFGRFKPPPERLRLKGQVLTRLILAQWLFSLLMFLITLGLLGMLPLPLLLQFLIAGGVYMISNALWKRLLQNATTCNFLFRCIPGGQFCRNAVNRTLPALNRRPLSYMYEIEAPTGFLHTFASNEIVIPDEFKPRFRSLVEKSRTQTLSPADLPDYVSALIFLRNQCGLLSVSPTPAKIAA